MEDKPVTLSALNRVENKFDKFIAEQQVVNNKVFNTLERLDDTLSNLDTTLKVKTERESHWVKALERSQGEVDRNDRRLQDIEKHLLQTEATVKTVKFIMFTLIPLLPTLVGVFSYFLR
jgi:ABC-type transporter Mla subunit MlaD